MEPSGEAALRERVLDEEHLRLLALFHYVSGGMTLAFSLFFAVMMLFMGLVFANIPAPHPGQHPPPVEIFWMFGVFIFIGALLGVLDIIAARCMSLRRGRVFSMIVSIPNLLFIPYGTILTIFTLLVLDRGSVKRLYEERAA
jgi:hypothetical protein